MSDFLNKNANTIGHLIVTIAALIFCGVLVVASQDTGLRTAVMGIAMTLIGYWFGVGQVQPSSVTAQPLQGVQPADLTAQQLNAALSALPVDLESTQKLTAVRPQETKSV